MLNRALALVLCLGGAVTALADTPPLAPDIPPQFDPPSDLADYVKREVMIPMRDGIKLHTLIYVPQGVTRGPLLLTRTPYSAASRSQRAASPHLLATLPMSDEVFAFEGYIRVWQDVRGKYGSEGEYVVTRPLRGPLNSSDVDHSTDAYDTIDWLVKNVPESNGRVGMIGGSYEGFTVLMALIDPHPALKVAVPISSMVDGWKGDDWFHNGAFRQTSFDYFYSQTTARGDGRHIARGMYDDFADFLSAGSAADYARKYGIDRLPYFRKVSEHPSYDGYWQAQALDKILSARPQTVPTLHVASLWDQEDMYGALHTYAVTEAQDAHNDRNFLVLGPWRHSGANYDGTTLGPLRFEGNTALQYREGILKPFLDQYLKEGAPRAAIPPVSAYETGTNRWRRLQQWPPACDSGCARLPNRLYLGPHFSLSLERDLAAPPVAGSSFDEYVSDPAKPVPYVTRPVRFDDGDAWKRWLVSDQRAFADRTDVLVYTTEVLDRAVRISGEPVANLFASTSGTDGDWVVKLIDVYPDEVPSQPELGGYQLGISMEIFRGRYRESLEHPRPITPNTVLRYRFALPTANHVFLPGHRIMAQIQSSWFPLYDRNPQHFVENIFFAKTGDYRKALQRIYRSGNAASFIELPLVDP
ncbi:MAG: CocE/NonD family hydrolase [Gammaproteobacteria bacterium]